MAAKPKIPPEMKPLTGKQEAFTLAFFETGNAAEAYRRAYDVGENTKDGWLYVEACQLLDNPKITLRLDELKTQAERHSIYTRQKALEELEDARAEAMKIGAPAAAVSAINAKVKLYGLDAPTKIKAEVTGKDGAPLSTIDPTALSTKALREIMGALNAKAPEPDAG